MVQDNYVHRIPVAQIVRFNVVTKNQQNSRCRQVHPVLRINKFKYPNTFVLSDYYAFKKKTVIREIGISGLQIAPVSWPTISYFNMSTWHISFCGITMASGRQTSYESDWNTIRVTSLYNCSLIFEAIHKRILGRKLEL